MGLQKKLTTLHGIQNLKKRKEKKGSVQSNPTFKTFHPVKATH